MTRLQKHSIAAVLLVIFFALVFRAQAQDDTGAPAVTTSISLSCANADLTHLAFFVESDGVEDYTVSFPAGDVPNTLPTSFTTQVGKYVLGTIDYSEHGDVQIDFTRYDGETASFTVSYDYASFCDHDDITEPLPVPTPTPEPTDEPTDVPTLEAPAPAIVQVQVQATGKTCTIKYPLTVPPVLVCQ